MTENLLLTHLIALRSDLKSRMSGLESAVVTVKRDVNHRDYAGTGAVMSPPRRAA